MQQLQTLQPIRTLKQIEKFLCKKKSQLVRGMIGLRSGSSFLLADKNMYRYETHKLNVDEEGEFRSCCEDNDEDKKECSEVDFDGNLDEHSVKLYFKGFSIAGPGNAGSRISGVGVVMERSNTSANASSSTLQVQKKLDFFVEELVADYLALLEGLSVAIQNNVHRAFVVTDCEILYNQMIKHDEVVESPLVEVLRQKILEQVNEMEAFVLKLVPAADLEKASHLARVAVGIVSMPTEGDELAQICSVCCEEKLSSMMLTLKCSHRFCSHCMKTYVVGKLFSSHVPIRCLQLGCRYCISATECRLFLPVTFYESFERALADSNVLHSNKIYCPYSSCSVLLDTFDGSSTRASSSSKCDNSCLECPVCQHFICVDCGVPWHSSMTCEEYQNLSLEDRNASNLTSRCVAQNRRCRRCQQCRMMLELNHGCYHMTCWCGHEFCYSCGSEYKDSKQTCQCALWDEDYSEEFVTYPPRNPEQWAWDSFESLPLMMNAYSNQERSQLALIQRFLAGGFNFNDQDSHQASPRCTDSYAETMKDLHQLPWLERFVSVITDDYYENYVK